jgi:hypothetical protein
MRNQLTIQQKLSKGMIIVNRGQLTSSDLEYLEGLVKRKLVGKGWDYRFGSRKDCWFWKSKFNLGRGEGRKFPIQVIPLCEDPRFERGEIRVWWLEND